MSCPFCKYQPASQLSEEQAVYDLGYHVEVEHNENDGPSPFEVRAGNAPTEQLSNANGGSPQTRARRLSRSEPDWPLPPSPRSFQHDSDRNEYLDCPQGCGELIPAGEMRDHLKLHETMEVNHDSSRSRSNSRNQDARSATSGRTRRSAPGSAYSGTSSSHHLRPPSLTLRQSSLRPRSARSADEDDLKSPRRRRHHSKPTSPLSQTHHFSRPASPTARSQSVAADPTALSTSNIKRLGKKELGPHAFEDRMPIWLYQQLERGPPLIYSQRISTRDGRLERVGRVVNELSNMAPIVARLLELDPNVKQAWICGQGVRHIFKQKGEGGFCGYRNIQMLVSWMQHAQGSSWQRFEKGVLADEDNERQERALKLKDSGRRQDERPEEDLERRRQRLTNNTVSILRLQRLIEKAWDQGFNENARQETGGIIGTRKYIGTPEAQALFCSLDVPCSAQAFTKSKVVEKGQPVFELLLEHILQYFAGGLGDQVQTEADKITERELVEDRPDGQSKPDRKVYMTGSAPIYFQHPGHSMTIVGAELRKSGRINLLVFDPMFSSDPPASKYLDGRPTTFTTRHPDKYLKAFRRGEDYLKKYKSFEILCLEGWQNAMV